MTTRDKARAPTLLREALEQLDAATGRARNPFLEALKRLETLAPLPS